MNQGAIVGVIITLILIALGLIIRKSKILLLLQTTWIWILMVFNTDSADFTNNSGLYYLANNTHMFSQNFFGSAFFYFSTIAKRLGMNYLTFNGILATISTLIIAAIILRYSSNPCIVISFFMWYPLVSSIIQKRWYFAMGILVLAVSILLLNKSKVEKTIWLLLLITFACMFHAGAVYYYTLVLYYWIPDKWKKYVSIIGFIILTLGKNQLSGILSTSSNSDLSDKSKVYFQTLASNNIWHFIFWICWQLLFVGLIFYLIKRQSVREILGDNYCNFLWLINWWSILIIPLYSFDPVFNRLFRIVIIFNYIAISNLLLIKDRKISKINFYSNIYQLILCISTFFIVNALAGAPIDQLVFPIFNSNIVLNFFN